MARGCQICSTKVPPCKSKSTKKQSRSEGLEKPLRLLGKYHRPRYRHGSKRRVGDQCGNACRRIERVRFNPFCNLTPDVEKAAAGVNQCKLASCSQAEGRAKNFR